MKLPSFNVSKRPTWMIVIDVACDNVFTAVYFVYFSSWLKFGRQRLFEGVVWGIVGVVWYALCIKRIAADLHEKQQKDDRVSSYVAELEAKLSTLVTANAGLTGMLAVYEEKSIPTVSKGNARKSGKR